MKTRFFTFLFLLTFGYQTVSAQVKQGKIIYKINYPGLNLPASQKAMLPSESTCYFSNNNCRTESDGIMGMKMVTICAYDKMTILMDVMGKKIAMDPRKEQSMKAKTPTISYTNDTKQIAGYECRKAILTFDENTKMTVWCAEGITGGGSWGGNFENLKGAPLEYTADVNEMSMTMVATKVIEEKVSKKMFDIPSDYEFMTPEQLQQQFK